MTRELTLPAGVVEQRLYRSMDGGPMVYLGRKPVGAEFIPWGGTSFSRVDEGPWIPAPPRS